MEKESQDESFEIDLSDATSAKIDDNLSYISGGADTITIAGIDLNDYSYNYTNMSSSIGGLTSAQIGALGASTITLPSSSLNYNSNYTINTGSSGQFFTSGSNGTSWANGSSNNTVNISTSGIDMAAGTDIKIDGKSLKAFISKMEDRLAILVPDPAKLEKFEALKRAYEHYKTMESLCFDEPKEEN